MLDAILSSSGFLLALSLVSLLATALADITAGKIRKGSSSGITFECKDKEGRVIRITIPDNDSEKASDLMRKIESALKEQDNEKSEQEC